MAGKKIQAQLTPEEKLQQALVPEAEQSYKIPANWCWTRLGNVTNIIMGQSPNGGSITENEKDTPLIGGAADMGEKYPEIKRYTNKPTKISSDEDLIICVRATLGKPIFSDGRYCLGRGVAAIRPLVGSRKLYKYFFLNFEQYLFDNATGTTFAQVNSNILQKMPLALPPLAEQQRIVERIESLFAKLDEAKENLQNVLDGFETRKAAIFHKAFTGELTANWRKQHGVSMESWEERKIENIGSVKGGKRVPKGLQLTLENTGHPYIKAGNLKQGTVIKNDIMFVPEKVWNIIKNYTVSAGDVYITNVGACIGDCGIIPEEFDGANLTENAVKITDLLCNNKFLSYYLSSNSIQSFIKTLIASATLGKLSIFNIKNIQLNLPTLPEQTEIVRIIDDLLAKEQQAKELAENALAKIDLIKKSILARAFRGELGTNNLADEPAVELLKRML